MESNAGGNWTPWDKEGEEKCSCRAETSTVAPAHRLCSWSCSHALWERWSQEWPVGVRAVRKWVGLRGDSENCWYTGLGCYRGRAGAEGRGVSPSPSHHSRLIQSPCLSFLSHTANSHWLSILHMVMQVSMLLFPYTSLSPPLSPCPRTGTATPVHHPQRPVGSTQSSTSGLRPPEQLE